MNKRKILRDAIQAITDSTNTPLLPRGAAQNPEGTLVALKHYTAGMHMTFLLELALGIAVYAYVANHTTSLMLKCATSILIGIGLVIIKHHLPHNIFAWTASMRHVGEYLTYAKVILEEVGCPQITLIDTWARTERKSPDQLIASVLASITLEDRDEKRIRRLVNAHVYFFRNIRT